MYHVILVEIVSLQVLLLIFHALMGYWIDLAFAM